jgi:hypothetical protein
MPEASPPAFGILTSVMTTLPRSLLAAVILLAACGPSEPQTVSQDGATITAPAGAVPDGVVLGVEGVDEAPVPLPIDQPAVSEIFELTPHGVQFNAPVTVELPFNVDAVGEDLTGIGVLTFDDIGPTDVGWTAVSGVTFDESGLATFDVTGFSFFVVAELPAGVGDDDDTVDDDDDDDTSIADDDDVMDDDDAMANDDDAMANDDDAMADDDDSVDDDDSLDDDDDFISDDDDDAAMDDDDSVNDDDSANDDDCVSPDDDDLVDDDDSAGDDDDCVPANDDDSAVNSVSQGDVAPVGANAP